MCTPLVPATTTTNSGPSLLDMEVPLRSTTTHVPTANTPPQQQPVVDAVDTGGLSQTDIIPSLMPYHHVPLHMVPSTTRPKVLDH